MQHTSKHIIRISLAIILAITTLSVSVFAKGSVKERRLTGVILSVAHNARTLLVREFNSHKSYIVRVDSATRLLRIASNERTYWDFDALHPGLVFSDGIILNDGIDQ